MTKPKGLRRKRGFRVTFTAYLEETEKKLLEQYCRLFSGGSKARSGASKAAASLLRLGIRCILSHSTETPDQEPLTDQELETIGLAHTRGFTVQKTKAQIEKERREWKSQNPPEPVKRLR